MTDVAQRRAADRWFLERGLPAVLRPGALVRRVWPRSAPALAAVAVFMLNSALVVVVTGKHTIASNTRSASIRGLGPPRMAPMIETTNDTVAAGMVA